MRILFIADTHGMQDMKKVRDKIPRMGLYPDDAIVHLGDMGIREGNKAHAWWSCLPCNVLLCLGNHEDYGWIESLPLSVRYGAKGRRLSQNIFAPLCGQTAGVFGKTLFFYSGAYSLSFRAKTAGESIFKEELEECGRAKQILDGFIKDTAQVDFIISHDGPVSLVENMLGVKIKAPPAAYFSHLGIENGSRLHAGFALDRILKENKPFSHWLFGHHHIDKALGNVRCLFEDILAYDVEKDTFTVY